MNIKSKLTSKEEKLIKEKERARRMKTQSGWCHVRGMQWKLNWEKWPSKWSIIKEWPMWSKCLETLLNFFCFLTESVCLHCLKNNSLLLHWCRSIYLIFSLCKNPTSYMLTWSYQCKKHIVKTLNEHLLSASLDWKIPV